MAGRLAKVPRRFSDILAWSRTHQGKKLIRFFISSVLTTFVSLTVILITYGFRIVPGVFEATLIGNVVAIIPSYYLNRAWAWGKRGKSHFRNEVVPYWTMSFLAISFSLLGASWVKYLVHRHDFTHSINTLLVAGVNLLSFAIFWVLKILLFNRIFHTDKLHDIEEHLVAEEQAVN